MRKYRVYVSLLVFALLMGIKCFQPELAENIRQQVLETIDRDEDFQLLLETLGREYAESGLRKELFAVLGVDEWSPAEANEQAAEAGETPDARQESGS